MDRDFSSDISAASAWVEAGGYELNVAGVCGAPTLRPSPGLERCLALDLAGGSSSLSPIRLGVHLHAFYLMEAEHIIGLLQQALPPFDLLITTDTTDKQHALGAILARFASPPWQQRLEIRVVPNRGRNIVPLLRDGVPFLNDCQLILHLHTKRTSHKTFGSDWLNDLLAGMIGNGDRVGALIQSFVADPGLGLVMPLPSELIRPYLNWGANFEIASLLVHTLWPGRSLHLQAPLVFPPGMMFWARPAALAPLVGALPAFESLAPEPLLDDGTPLHALERLTAHACEVAGLRWAFAGNGSMHSDPQAGVARALPLSLSVWEPQPEAYLEGVAALGARHRQLQHDLEERDRQLQAILNHRDSLEMSLSERDRGLAERDAALSECRREQQRALMDHRDSLERSLLERDQGLAERETALSECRREQQQAEAEHRRQLQTLLDQRDRFETLLLERDQGLAERDAALLECRREQQQAEAEHRRQLQTLLDQRVSLERSLFERDQGLIKCDAALSEGRQELLIQQNIQRQQLQTILEQTKLIEASLADCSTNVRDLKVEQLAMRQSRTWRLADKLRSLGTMFR